MRQNSDTKLGLIKVVEDDLNTLIEVHTKTGTFPPWWQRENVNSNFFSISQFCCEIRGSLLCVPEGCEIWFMKYGMGPVSHRCFKRIKPKLPWPLTEVLWSHFASACPKGELAVLPESAAEPVRCLLILCSS